MVEYFAFLAPHVPCVSAVSHMPQSAASRAHPTSAALPYFFRVSLAAALAGFCYSSVGLFAQGLSNFVRVSNVYGTAFLEIAVRGTRDPRRCGTTPSASKGRRGARASSHSPPRVHKAHLRLPFKYKILCSPSRLSNHPRLRVESEAAV